MKAQFFVLGAILLASLFFVGMPLTGYIIKPLSEDLNCFAENIEEEFPNTLNLVIESGDIERLGDFSRFMDSQMNQRNADFRNLWVIAEGQGSNVNVTVGNYLDEDVTVILNISNTVNMILMPSGTTDSVMFFSVPAQYTLRVSFPGLDRELSYQRNKINLYSYFSLSREDDVIIEEVVA